MSARVTVGVPVYNGARFLERTLASLCAQDADVRIVVADNASTDESFAIASGVAARDPRVTVHRNEANLGAVRNFNLLLEGAQTELFMWAGAHDVFAPTYVSTCCRLLDAHPDVVLAYTRTQLIDAQDRPLEVTPDVLDTRGTQRAQRYAAVVWSVSWYNLVHGVMRTHALRATGGFRNIWAPDHLLIAELALRGEFAQSSDVLFSRREVRKESAEEHQARVLADLDPATVAARVTRERVEHFRELRDAHLALLERAPLGATSRAVARAITFAAYAFHHGVPFPGQARAREAWRLLPAPLRSRVLTDARRFADQVGGRPR